jgi:hypothetical protein
VSNGRTREEERIRECERETSDRGSLQIDRGDTRVTFKGTGHSSSNTRLRIKTSEDGERDPMSAGARNLLNEYDSRQSLLFIHSLAAWLSLLRQTSAQRGTWGIQHASDLWECPETRD